MRDKRKKMVFGMMVLLFLATNYAFAGVVNLPQTGQIISYYDGDDGDWLAGVSWPTPRFMINNDGNTVMDNLTGLEWMRDGSVPTLTQCQGGFQTWQTALDYVKCLNTNKYLGYTDWRLPNINELKSLVNVGRSNSAKWLNGQGFVNMQPAFYWSSSTYAADTNSAWVVNMTDGSVVPFAKTKAGCYVLPVRGGVFSNYQGTEGDKNMITGGRCEYREYLGYAEVISAKVVKDNAAEKDKFEIKFKFYPDETVEESFANPEGREFLVQLNFYIEPGKKINCKMKVIKKGTCTPIIFEFPEMES
jgi:hypothetical protein